MICPQCGYDIGSKHKCMRCGYEVKTLVAVDETDAHKENKRDEPETKVIDPDRVFISSGDEYGDDFFDDPFGSVFGSLFGFDPIGDLLGGLFGLDVRSSRREPEPKYIPSEEELEQGPHAEIDKVVEVKKVEYLDENGEPIKKDGKIKQTFDKVKKKVQDIKHKNDGENPDK